MYIKIYIYTCLYLYIQACVPMYIYIWDDPPEVGAAGTKSGGMTGEGESAPARLAP